MEATKYIKCDACHVPVIGGNLYHDGSDNLCLRCFANQVEAPDGYATRIVDSRNYARGWVDGHRKGYARCRTNALLIVGCAMLCAAMVGFVWQLAAL